MSVLLLGPKRSTKRVSFDAFLFSPVATLPLLAVSSFDLIRPG